MSEPQEAGKTGYVYAFTNKGMPYLIKIGKTKYPPEEKRLRCAKKKDPYKSPYPFKIGMAKRVSDRHDAEKKLHQYFADKRIIPEEDGLPTEFFEISIEEVAAGFATIEGEPWVQKEPVVVVKDHSVIGWAGGGRHMTREEKEASGFDVKAHRDRNHTLETSKTGLEEAAALDVHFNSKHKLKAYEPKLLVMRHICAALGIANSCVRATWDEAAWADILVAFTTPRTWGELPEGHPYKTSSLISRAKWTFGRTDSDKKQIGPDMYLAHDLNGILEAWTGSTLKNEGVATDGRKATSPIKVALGPPLPNYTTWAAEMRETLKAEGLKGNAISSEIGKRWAALKSAVGYIAPKSVHIKKFVLRP